MTDHKEEAARNIEGLHDFQSEEGISDVSMLTVAIEAQVHATLYLAEQQRIANLIAYVAEWNLGLARGSYGPTDGREKIAEAIAQINSGLGLA